MVKTMGDKIKLKRFANGQSQSQFAALLRVPKTLVSLWERDAKTPSEEHRYQLIDILGLDAAFITRSPNS